MHGYGALLGCIAVYPYTATEVVAGNEASQLHQDAIRTSRSP